MVTDKNKLFAQFVTGIWNTMLMYTTDTCVMLKQSNACLFPLKLFAGVFILNCLEITGWT